MENDGKKIVFKDKEHERFLRRITKNADIRTHIMRRWCTALELVRIQEHMRKRSMILRMGM